MTLAKEIDEWGATKLLTPEIVRAALGLVKKGKVYSLGQMLEPGMPQLPRPVVKERAARLREFERIMSESEDRGERRAAAAGIGALLAGAEAALRLVAEPPGAPRT